MERDHVVYESRLEPVWLIFADFDRAVHRSLAQPFLLKAKVDAKVPPGSRAKGQGHPVFLGAGHAADLRRSSDGQAMVALFPGWRRGVGWREYAYGGTGNGGSGHEPA